MKGALQMREAIRQFVRQTKYDIKCYIYLSAFRVR